MGAALVFVIMTMAAHRVTRLITADVWPPIAKARRYLIHKAGPSPWGEIYTCSWCMGAHVSIIMTAIVWALHGMPMPVLQMLACSTGVGLLSRITEHD